MRPTQQAPVRVAIVGGGCAGVAAAFELSRPEHLGKYAITLYQQGFRLGGKGASGRGPADRIEEHGLHLWMGFYENAFRLMRECYAELGRSRQEHRIADWTDAFFPDQLTGVADKLGQHRWVPWAVTLPPAPGMPGDPGPVRRWTIGDYMSRAVTLLRSLLEAIQLRDASWAGAGSPSTPAHLSPGDVSNGVLRFLRFGGLATMAAVIEAIGLLQSIFASAPLYADSFILRFHDAVRSAARQQIDALVSSDAALRRLWEIAELIFAVLRGVVRFRLMSDPRGFEAIDEYDCREWLAINGASERAINSAFVRALYDLAFAYEDGNPERPRIAAGQALRGTLRAFFTYRGAFFWKMRAGMGDIVFAPFYEVLRKRGVKFAFFHRLKNVGLAPKSALERDGQSFVQSLEFDVQARVKGGGEYLPLVDVRGLPCFPSTPDFAQLERGAELSREKRQFESHWDARMAGKKKLEVTRDFDLVVLAVGGGAIPHTCKELVESDPRWRIMVDKVQTVATQAFQIWLRPDMKDLGWNAGPISISGFVEPFDTWADMTHLAAEETWAEPPGAIAYFCSVLPNRDLAGDVGGQPAASREIVKRNAITFLNRSIAHLWPKAQRAGGTFRWELLVDPARHPFKGAAGEARFDTQYWTANVNPSDRYVLCLPGSTRYRISPLDDTYDNLTVAGDWTDCGFNEGCVEAAFISGRLAAHALSGSPRLEEIVGFDHP